LEICAGGRLFNVVVESADVGKALLQNGQLRKRVTIIPIDKISPNVAASETMKAVNKVSNGQAALALDLVDCDDDVRRAMEYVFGNTLICPDPETAKAVTFNDKIRMKSVTLEGDVYDPSGTLSGGSKSKSGGLLIRVQELKAIERELDERKRALITVEKEWEKARGEMDRFKGAKKARDLKVHEVGLLEERVGESNATRVSFSSF
jgi:structural maintenance of chromosome 2